MSDEHGKIGRLRRRFRTEHPGFRGLGKEPLPQLHGAVLALAAVTGLFHIVVGLRYVSNAVGGGFILYLGLSVMAAGVAFLVGVVLAGIGIGRGLIYRLGIPFTAAQILSWYWFNRPIDLEDTLGIVDKTIQVALIVCLIVLIHNE